MDHKGRLSLVGTRPWLALQLKVLFQCALRNASTERNVLGPALLRAISFTKCSSGCIIPLFWTIAKMVKCGKSAPKALTKGGCLGLPKSSFQSFLLLNVTFWADLGGELARISFRDLVFDPGSQLAQDLT